MPLIAHNKLPSFERLAQEGLKVLSPDVAVHQDIRELHIGLLNMMPDSALEATERQFFRLIGESTPVAQLFVHPFSLDVLPRGERARQHIATYYESFEKLKEEGLDALIITGANVVGSNLPAEVFWEPFKEVADWAEQNVTSTLCSCLATHALLEYRYDQRRETQPQKKWGVFKHHVVESRHPLVEGINSRFDVPHSRWNTVYPEQYQSYPIANYSGRGVTPGIIDIVGNQGFRKFRNRLAFLQSLMQQVFILFTDGLRETIQVIVR